MELNKDGVAAPGGGDWGFSTINGNTKRGNGILINEMYVGRIVWNRQRFVKDPETGKRQARMEGSASIEAARSEIKRIDRELDTLLDLILKGSAADRINSKMVQLESRKAELEQVLSDADEPPPLLHSEMATFYREQVRALHEALQADTEATRLKAGEVLRPLVKEIVLTPGGKELKIEVRGDLAVILAIALKTKTPATGAGVSQFELVAGIGFEPMTFRL
ncbi:MULTISPECIES: recombinase family protein [unclassified Bradyrhizobium]